MSAVHAQPPGGVSLADVGMRFANGTQALDGVSLAVAPGEFLSLVGPSGCGKSTLLRLVAGLDRPTQGTVTVDGETAGCGFVFQEPTLMPWASVRDNVWLPLRIAGISRRDARPIVDALLESVGLAGFERAHPHELSGGMRMRVSIARALAPRPRLLLMDEPFAALDEITRSRLNDDLLAWCREHGLTVLFVTHSVYEAVYLSGRVLVMSPRPGRIVDAIEVAAPRPRPAGFRTSAEYAGFCGRASRALRTAMGETA